jgi:hypothetical protein
MLGSSRVAAQLAASQEGLSSMSENKKKKKKKKKKEERGARGSIVG